MYTHDRKQLRAVFFRAWENYRNRRPLAGAEKLIVDVIVRHPEYQTLLDDPDTFQDRDYSPDFGMANPFLHLSMHVAVEEQLSIDQPGGVRARYQRLLEKTGDAHAAQHQMMECLGEMLWQMQRHGGAPDAAVYFGCLDKLDKIV